MKSKENLWNTTKDKLPVRETKGHVFAKQRDWECKGEGATWSNEMMPRVEISMKFQKGRKFRKGTFCEKKIIITKFFNIYWKENKSHKQK